MMSSSGILSKTELKPGWNGYQYVMIFISGFLLDLMVHFLVKRKYDAQRMGQDLFGPSTSLMSYYRALEWGFESEYVKTFVSWLMGGILGGILCAISLLFADVFLQVADVVESSKA